MGISCESNKECVMLKSYEFIRYLGLDPKTNQYRWEYRIVDDDWEEVGVVVENKVAGAFAVGVGVAVIDTYSKKGLPVAPNLIRAFQFESQKYGYILEQLIAWHKRYNPKFTQYEDEINRLLVLL